MTKETYKRAGRRGYTTVENEIIDDNQVTLEGKGLMTVLLSNDKERWEIRMPNIISRSKNGRDAHYNVLWHLIEQGYYARLSLRENGRYKEIIHIYGAIKEDVRLDVEEAIAKATSEGYQVEIEYLMKKPVKNKKKKDDDSGENSPVTESQDTEGEIHSPNPESQDTEIQDTDFTDTDGADAESQYNNNTKGDNPNLDNLNLDKPNGYKPNIESKPLHNSSSITSIMDIVGDVDIDQELSTEPELATEEEIKQQVKYIESAIIASRLFTRREELLQVFAELIQYPDFLYIDQSDIARAKADFVKTQQVGGGVKYPYRYFSNGIQTHCNKRMIDNKLPQLDKRPTTKYTGKVPFYNWLIQ